MGIETQHGCEGFSRLVRTPVDLRNADVEIQHAIADQVVERLPDSKTSVEGFLGKPRLHSLVSLRESDRGRTHHQNQDEGHAGGAAGQGAKVDAPAQFERKPYGEAEAADVTRRFHDSAQRRGAGSRKHQTERCLRAGNRVETEGDEACQ